MRTERPFATSNLMLLAASGALCVLCLTGGAAAQAKPNATPPVAPSPGAERPRPGTLRPTPLAVPAAVPGANPPVPGQGGAAAGATANNNDAVPTTPMPIVDKGDTFSFGPFAEPVEVKLLADLVAAKLNIQILATDVALRDKKVLLLTAVDIQKDKLLEFLNFLLAQNGQALTRDVTGIYMIKPASEIEARVGVDPFSTTRIISTPGLKPSALAAAISNLLGGGGGGGMQQVPGQPPQPMAGGGGGRMTYLDDLGIILITDTPRRIAIVQELVDTLSREQSNVQFTRFALRHISAPAARQRILEQLGRVSQRTGMEIQAALQQQQQIQPGIQGGGGQTISSLADRLTIDPQSNALLFRGKPDEMELLTRMVTIVDVLTSLEGKWYPIGSAAATVAQQAQRLGLGTLITLQNGQQDATAVRALAPGQPGGAFGQNNQASEMGGSTFVLDGQGRGFMYYGTAEQQQRVEKLTEEFAPLTELESVVYEFYKLRHSEAEKVAEVIQGLLSNSVPTSSSPLLPSGGNRAGTNNRLGARINTSSPLRQAQDAAAIANAAAAAATAANNDTAAIEASADVFVLADKSNNQIVVKAPRRLQAQFARLIDRLDLRKPQVYVDAKIIQVTDSDEFRLAVESQLINAGGTGGVGTQRFPGGPLGIPTGTAAARGILTPGIVNPVTGLTAAIIKSDMVPIVITALASTTDARVVAEPKLLVDDNEEASIRSLEQRPTSTTTTTGGTGGGVVNGFGGFEDAGPELTVTPQISSGDYLRLKYELKLSSFVGEGVNGSPPPRLLNEIKSDSVTVPSDSTIILGGLVFDNIRNTVFKVPLLGDIPLIGQAFRDERKTSTRTRLYVFLTPRILRDNTFEDLRLLSRGPMRAAKAGEMLPESKPERMDIAPPVNAPPRGEPLAPIGLEAPPSAAGN